MIACLFKPPTAEMAQSVMLSCVEYRFGNDHTPHTVEWLTDNGACFKAKETTEFGSLLGLQCRFTPVRSPQSNGMAELFVKTFKRDYIFSHRRETPQRSLIICWNGLRITTKTPLIRDYEDSLQGNSSALLTTESVRFNGGNSTKGNLIFKGEL